MFKVSSRTSAKTGVAPQWTITFAVDGHVIDVVITSSPGPTPSATSERCSAAVQDETASTWSASRYSRMRASSSAVRGPVVSQPERRVSATASISSSVIAGGWKERKSVRLVEESSGIRGEKAYAVGGGVRARQGLSARVADREHRTGTIGAPPQGREDVAGLPVDRGPGGRPPGRPAPRPTRARPAGATRNRVTAPPTSSPSQAGTRASPSAASIASPFRSTPVTASTSSASWPPPRRAATSITFGPSGPTRSWV